MKKFFIMLLPIAFLCVLLSSPYATEAAGASEILNNQTETETPSEKVEFSSLSKEEADFFKNEGFTEENEYFRTAVVQQPTSSTPAFSTFGVNVVILTGATKKVSATSGYTAYVITASKAGFTKLNTKLKYGTKSKTSAVIPYAKPKVYSGGIFFDHKGKKKYFGCKVTTQYYTSMGKGTVSSTAGGVTLGK